MHLKMLDNKNRPVSSFTHMTICPCIVVRCLLNGLTRNSPYFKVLIWEALG